MATKCYIFFMIFSFYCLVNAEKVNETFQRQDLASNLVGPGTSSSTSNDQFQGNVTINNEEIQQNVPINRKERGSLSNILTLLQRQSEKLSVIQNLCEQQLRRVDALEYRLTRIEVQYQEKFESLRGALSETSRQIQSLTYQGGQITTAIDSIRQSQTEDRQTLSLLASSKTITDSHNTATQMASNNELLTRFLSITNSLQNVKSNLVAISEQQSIFTNNFTTLINNTRQINLGQQYLVTKYGLSAAIAELRVNVAAMTCTQSQPPIKETSKIPTDCSMVQKDEKINKSGIYLIKPKSALKAFYVYCDLITRGGGWTVIQNRYEGTLDFYRDWSDYKRGFGNLGGEFWLGLDKIHEHTNSEVNELLIVLQDFTLENVTAYYAAFGIGSEVEGYPLTILSGYDGDAGDSLLYHAGMKFSTKDSDNDQWLDGNCAESHHGAWWYNGCDTSNLNGRYLNGELPETHEYQGMYWYDWRGPNYSLMKTKIMIRPKRIIKRFSTKDKIITTTASPLNATVNLENE